MFKNKQIYVTGMLLILILCSAVNVSAQVQFNTSDLTRAKVWCSMGNHFIYGTPNLYFSSDKYMLDYPGYSRQVDLDDALNYMARQGWGIYGVRDGVAAGYHLNQAEYPPEVFVTAVWPATTTKNYNMADPTILAEEYVTGRFNFKLLNLDISHKTMAWSFPKYDDFLVHEVTIVNVGNTPVTDLHFTMRSHYKITQRSVAGWQIGWDEKYGWNDTHKCFYFYDDRQFNWEDESLVIWNFGVGPERGDLGEAKDIHEQGSLEHELDAPGYVTCIVLDSAGTSVHQNILSIEPHDFLEVRAEDRQFQYYDDPPSRLKELMTHEQPHMSWDEARAAGGEGGDKNERNSDYWVSIGPITDLAAGDSVTLVLASVLGEMDRHKIVEGGVENIDLLAIESLGALLENITAVKEFYANGYVPLEGYPPPTPTDGENSLTLAPIGGGIEISWPPISDAYTDPLSGVNDFAGYRVYHSNYFTIGPWDLIKDISKAEADAMIENGMVVYDDMDVSFGVGNYYTVTSYDTDGNESGKVNNNRFPVYPLRTPNDNFSKKVYVVPNPFRQHSRLLGTNEQYRLEFINIPSKCNIKIYTMAGDLVKIINHDDGGGSEAWGSFTELDYMLSDWSLRVAPGIYIYKVESEVFGHEGETKIGKFAIVK